MTRSTNITIGSQLDNFESEMIESGYYDEEVRSRQVLRLLKDQETKSTALRAAIEAGEQSSESNLTLSEIASMIKKKQSL